MSLAQWRQFNFFDKQQTTDPIEKGKTPPVFQVKKNLLHPFLFYIKERVSHLFFKKN